MLPVAVETVVLATIEATEHVATVTVVLTAVLAVWLTLVFCGVVMGVKFASELEDISRSVCVATGTCVCLLIDTKKNPYKQSNTFILISVCQIKIT